MNDACENDKSCQVAPQLVYWQNTRSDFWLCLLWNRLWVLKLRSPTLQECCVHVAKFSSAFSGLCWRATQKVQGTLRKRPRRRSYLVTFGVRNGVQRWANNTGRRWRAVSRSVLGTAKGSWLFGAQQLKVHKETLAAATATSHQVVILACFALVLCCSLLLCLWYCYFCVDGSIPTSCSLLHECMLPFSLHLTLTHSLTHSLSLSLSYLFVFLFPSYSSLCRLRWTMVDIPWIDRNWKQRSKNWKERRATWKIKHNKRERERERERERDIERDT